MSDFRFKRKWLSRTFDSQTTKGKSSRDDAISASASCLSIVTGVYQSTVLRHFFRASISAVKVAMPKLAEKIEHRTPGQRGKKKNSAYSLVCSGV